MEIARSVGMSCFKCDGGRIAWKTALSTSRMSIDHYGTLNAARCGIRKNKCQDIIGTHQLTVEFTRHSNEPVEYPTTMRQRTGRAVILYLIEPVSYVQWCLGIECESTVP